MKGAAFFGIHASPDLNWNENGTAFMGNGPKLAALAAQYGMKSFRTSIEQTFTDRTLAIHRLDQILTDVKGHPLSLNVSPEEANAKRSQTMTGVPKSPEHREAMALAKEGNQNAFAHAKSEEVKQQISETKTLQKLKWVHNPETKEEMQIESDELDLLTTSDIFKGFQLGRLPKKLKS